MRNLLIDDDLRHGRRGPDLADPATGIVSREKSRVLRIITVADGAPDKTAAVADAYRKQFGQKSVGIITRDVCASF